MWCAQWTQGTVVNNAAAPFQQHRYACRRLAPWPRVAVGVLGESIESIECTDCTSPQCSLFELHREGCVRNLYVLKASCILPSRILPYSMLSRMVHSGQYVNVIVFVIVSQPINFATYVRSCTQYRLAKASPSSAYVHFEQRQRNIVCSRMTHRCRSPKASRIRARFRLDQISWILGTVRGRAHACSPQHSISCPYK